MAPHIDDSRAHIMDSRTLGGLRVAALGLGCMGAVGSRYAAGSSAGRPAAKS